MRNYRRTLSAPDSVLFLTPVIYILGIQNTKCFLKFLIPNS